MPKINREDPKNKEFWCNDFMKFVTYNRCMKHCGKPDKEQCATCRLEEDIELDRIIDERKEFAKNAKCSNCGSDYIVDTPFVFMCGDCGYIFTDQDEEDDKE